MQFQIGDKFIQKKSPVFPVGFQCFLALMLQKEIVPVGIIGIIGMVLFDVFHKGTVPVAQVLPPLVVVGFAVHHIINAELGLVVAGACKVGFIKPRDNHICTGEGECFALM